MKPGCSELRRVPFGMGVLRECPRSAQAGNPRFPVNSPRWVMRGHSGRTESPARPARAPQPVAERPGPRRRIAPACGLTAATAPPSPGPPPPPPVLRVGPVPLGPARPRRAIPSPAPSGSPRADDAGPGPSTAPGEHAPAPAGRCAATPAPPAATGPGSPESPCRPARQPLLLRPRAGWGTPVSARSRPSVFRGSPASSGNSSAAACRRSGALCRGLVPRTASAQPRWR